MLQCKTKYHHLNINIVEFKQFLSMCTILTLKERRYPKSMYAYYIWQDYSDIYTLRHTRNCNKSLRDSIFLQSPWPVCTPTSVHPTDDTHKLLCIIHFLWHLIHCLTPTLGVSEGELPYKTRKEKPEPRKFTPPQSPGVLVANTKSVHKSSSTPCLLSHR